MTHGVNACRGAFLCCICGAAPDQGLAQLLRATPLPDGLALEYVRTHATPYFLSGGEVSKPKLEINMLWLKA